MSTTGEFSVTYIPNSPSLDPITVFWQNFGPGKGRVTIECYGSAWSCYFGAMRGCTIQQFFGDCDRGYLFNKMGYTQWLKQTKSHEKYLKQIIEAVQQSLRSVPELDREAAND